MTRTSLSYETPATDTHTDSRRKWMATLAQGDRQTLQTFAATLPADMEYEFLRRPEKGLIMLQARTGNTGQRFNLGEALVTRCVVNLRLNSGEKAVEGYAMVMGDNPEHAELAAVFDALMRTGLNGMIERGLLEPLRIAQRERERAKKEKTRRTKVDFYTMVRGEDA